jgi:acetolactate synthase-1/2/3 large subunit
MGYSLPAAVGAKMADPKRPTVAICGDGAFQMSMMELATAVQHGVDIKIVIMTNQRLGMVRELQTIGYGDRQTAVFLDGSPDFIKLAKAYGIDAMRVDGKGDVDKAIDMIVTHKGICLVEVVVDDMFPTR